MTNAQRKPKRPIRPEAHVVSWSDQVASILCPYCDQVHRHAQVRPGKREHRSPACDLAAHLTADQRAIGYTFRVEWTHPTIATNTPLTDVSGHHQKENDL